MTSSPSWTTRAAPVPVQETTSSAAAGESRAVEDMPSTAQQGRPARENSKATFREYSADSDTYHCLARPKGANEGVRLAACWSHVRASSTSRSARLAHTDP